MNKLRLVITVIALSITACKRERIVPDPIASFAVEKDTSQSVTISVYESNSLINTSTNADSFLWDLGNGTISTDKQASVYYSTPGTYVVTLTATNKDGKKSVATKDIKVVSPVLKYVTISSLNWKSVPAGNVDYPTGDKVNVWVEIVQGAPNQTYTFLSNKTFDAPLIYKSRVSLNVDSNAAPIVFDVGSKIIIDIPTLTLTYGYNGVGYGVNLYAEDTTGTHLLSSTFWGQVNTWFWGIVSQNRFTYDSELAGIKLTLGGDYE